MSRPSRNQTSYKGGLNYDHLDRYSVMSGNTRKRIVDLSALECERIVLAAMPNADKRNAFLRNLGEWDRYAKYYVFDRLASEGLIKVWMEEVQS